MPGDRMAEAIGAFYRLAPHVIRTVTYDKMVEIGAALADAERDRRPVVAYVYAADGEVTEVPIYTPSAAETDHAR